MKRGVDRLRRLSFPAALLLVAGCTSIQFDLTNIQEPVMLNPLPYPGAKWTATKLDGFRTEASYSKDGVSDGVAKFTGSTSTVNLEKEEQLKVFEAIGGHRNRVLQVRSIKAWAGGFNLLLLHSSQATVELYGDIVEIDRTSGPTEGSPSRPDSSASGEGSRTP